ncbi:TetR/AcrR family transcriptional regulator [Nocardia sp. NBC_01503]|uniref:TetR/AcrR family transcriptional regulator n=1 Tax=Nocardia sp. NBC_01503 TaxID=2975997 RepID=UPI002E7ACB8C|nr:TetR/AcrR family transcriptional regulator [Nocardia sp. NBC_01503]WTL30845.1 TetR/AcrR family transcriptional regulator [Nocardia sp. NBC_01503]
MTTEPATPRRSKKAEAQKQRVSKTGAPSRSGRGPRLSYDDWVDGALALLAKEGASAVRIPRLCEALGVTKGSFYWHFDAIEQLEEAMADRWSTTQARVIANLANLDSMPIEQRIEAMAAMLVERNWLVEATVREWSRTRPRVETAMRELDQRIFETIRAALTDLGFDAETARLRAGAMVYLGIGFIHGRGSLPIPTQDEVHTVIALLTRRT